MATIPDKINIRTELSLYTALERGETISQHALSKRLSISAGLVNTLIRRIVRKGLAKAQSVPPKRWAYFLTPKGFAEKSRLVASYLENSLAFFREARDEYVELFRQLRRANVQRVIFAGRGELLEIALLAAREADMEVVGILDSGANESSLLSLAFLRDLKGIDPSVALVITDSRQPQLAYDRALVQAEGRRILAPDFLCITPSSAGATKS